jgi:hypothetical protein
MLLRETKRTLISKKTYKRELAVALLIWFAYLVETKDINLVEVLVWPVFTYSALAFGIDWWGKSNGMQRNPSTQSTYGGRSQRSSEYPDWEKQPTDHWHVDRHGRPEDSPATS